ncbi:PLD nuclease N-terminal domain-containing protein [Planctomonas psychrotolerans]|uniref:PLD nuclease N-terminal domain-containing protein n=1 Tax=Planctomonas psychrotolerans TaxID=2528712 RepID=UPI00123A30FC|nr:PLD nuclease N-terminal domain-containing protein [Planctomonas psychrotolerans]
MPRILIGLAVVVVAVTIFAVVDSAMTSKERVRGISKVLWIFVILLFPIVGPVLWFLIGKDRSGGVRSTGRRLGPDDDPDFLRRLGTDADQDERIRRLEQELSDLDSDSDGDADNGSGAPGRRDA